MIDNNAILGNENEQYSRKSNIRVLGVQEPYDENCETQVCQLLHEKLGINITEDAIDAAHRVGAKTRQLQTNYREIRVQG